MQQNQLRVMTKGLRVSDAALRGLCAVCAILVVFEDDSLLRYSAV
jgi:hypothetical protein